MLSDKIISINRALVEAVELTEEEKKEGELEAKRKKYFKEKHKEYWEKLEYKKKVK